MIKKNALFGYLLLFLSIIIPTSLYSQGVWTQKANFGGGAVTEDRAFGIGSFGYVGTTAAGFWEYNPITDTWSQKSAFIGQARLSAVGFSIGTKGYFGTGGSFNDFYEYDQPTNTWSQKANFGGTGREGAVGCSIDGKGYIGTGGSYQNDWWEYDPVLDSWTQKANLVGPARYHGGSFSINSKGYISTGFNGNFFNDLWEYDPILNSWTAKASVPGSTRDRPVGLAVNGKGYIISGWTGSTALNDAWEYDPITDSWTQIPNFPGVARYNACGFVAGSKLYIGTGIANGTASDFYEYGPSCSFQATAQITSCVGVCDGTASVIGSVPSTTTYLWSSGDTTLTAANLCAGTYMVTVTDSAGCVATQSVIIPEPSAIISNATYVLPTCFGDGDGIVCVTPSGGTAPYSSIVWSTGDTTDCIANVSAGNYAVIITDSVGCSDSTMLTLNQPGPILLAITHLDASCPTCADGSASVGVIGGTLPYSYNWSNGWSLAFQNSLLPGTYTVCVTDVNGCIECDSVVVSFTSSLNNIDDVSDLFIVAPNPFMDQINVTVKVSDIIIERVLLVDISGRVMPVDVNFEGNNIKIIANNLSAGIYTVIISSKSNNWKIKLVK